MGKLTKKEIDLFHSTVYSFYELNGRELPWRKTGNPYHIIVSEIMLQQTQVSRVVQKYNDFIEMFPTLESLSNASLKDIYTVWQGLGYNRRALALQQCAHTIVTDFGGKVPSSEVDLVTLPGIGKATASSIAAFAFNIPSVFIETNIRSVYIHHFFSDQEYVSDKEIILLVEQTVDKKNPSDWYHAVMDYGVMLKAHYPYLNKKSAHYHRQSPFQGSERQVRGAILKHLNRSKSGNTVKELAKIIKSDQDLCLKLVLLLQKEGFLTMLGSRWVMV